MNPCLSVTGHSTKLGNEIADELVSEEALSSSAISVSWKSLVMPDAK